MSQHPQRRQRLNSLVYWKRAQHNLGASCLEPVECADAGWLVIDDITGCFVLAGVADLTMAHDWENSQVPIARIPGLQGSFHRLTCTTRTARGQRPGKAHVRPR